MDLKQIRELAEIVSQNKLTTLEVCDGELKIRLETAAAVCTSPVAAAASAAETLALPAAGADGENNAAINYTDLTDVKSPLVGIFYASPSPEALPFVTIGSEVKRGDVLCIVEAMKQMNEITAERDGEIVDICIKNGEIAEYGQVLFKLL